MNKIYGLNDLPNLLILKYFSFLLDMDSLLILSSLNHKYLKIYSNFRKGYKLMNDTGFIKEYHFPRYHHISKKEFFKHILLNQDFSQLYNLYGNPLHSLFKKEEFISLNNVKFLFENNADLNQLDETNKTPLQLCAINSENLEVIKYLFENKSDLNLKENSSKTALHFAALRKQFSFEIIKFLIENKSQVNSLDYKNNTPLHHMCANKNVSIEVLKYFIENKSNPDLKNIRKKNALSIACGNNSLIYKIFLQFGSIIDPKQSLKNILKKNK